MCVVYALRASPINASAGMKQGQPRFFGVG